MGVVIFLLFVILILFPASATLALYGDSLEWKQVYNDLPNLIWVEDEYEIKGYYEHKIKYNIIPAVRLRFDEPGHFDIGRSYLYPLFMIMISPLGLYWLNKYKDWFRKNLTKIESISTKEYYDKYYKEYRERGFRSF